MKIEVLGSACSGCKKLEENVRAAVNEAGSDADVSKVTNFTKIAEYGVMSLPALVIDGKVKCSGRIPDVSEIKKWL